MMIKLDKSVYKKIQSLRRATSKTHSPPDDCLPMNMPSMPQWGSKLHWPQEIPAKILISAEGSTGAIHGANKTESAIAFSVSYKWGNTKSCIQHGDAQNMKSNTSFSTPCQGFLTPNAFMRSGNMSLASVFCSPSGNTVKNEATQLPFSMSHLADSLPYQEACP
jgi:hypothetical protein